MKIKILGSGTSTGVPVPGCECAVCNSTDSRNQRLRTSAAIEIDRPDGSKSTILIDTATDLRTQILRSAVKRVDAVLYTHTHADHIFGIDDLRCFNFTMGSSIPLYAAPEHAAYLRKTFNYIFEPQPLYPGGALPQLELHEISALVPFSAGGETVLPLPLIHGRSGVVGYRIRNLAYLTDCSFIPPESLQQLQDLDLLILDGLRIRPHPTHFNLEQAAAQINALKPRRTIITHISHEVDHEDGNRIMRELTKLPVELGYDGMILEI